MKLPAYPEDLLQEDKEYVLKKLGLSEKEFEDITNLPVKSDRDYSSNTWIFNNFFANKCSEKNCQISIFEIIK